MGFQEDLDEIHWHLHLNSSTQAVYQALSTDDGRASFWAESAIERDGVVHFVFPNQLTWKARILQAVPAQCYTVRYFGNSTATFLLQEDGQGGTDLTLVDRGVSLEDRVEVIAGWVSVLMALKAAVEFGIDLRGHDPARTWDQGYVDN
jgi:hypothetical protein